MRPDAEENCRDGREGRKLFLFGEKILLRRMEVLWKDREEGGKTTEQEGRRGREGETQEWGRREERERERNRNGEE